jgi:hypothetical protein
MFTPIASLHRWHTNATISIMRTVTSSRLIHLIFFFDSSFLHLIEDLASADAILGMDEEPKKNIRWMSWSIVTILAIEIVEAMSIRT